MKLCILGYVPPPNIPGAEAYLANIRNWKTKHPLILFSDHDYGPEVKRIKASPEFIKGAKYTDGRDNKWAINNLIFLTGLRILAETDFTHFLYLEADCRVNGDCWDGIVWDEFLLRNQGAVVAGTLATYNVNNRNLAFSRCWHTFMSENKDAQFPITAYGGNGAAEAHEPAVFPNGALGIYTIDWLKKEFGLVNTVQLASAITAFDYEVGRRLVRQFGEEVFRKVLHLNSVYSSYGDVQTSEGERQEFLTTGKVVAVHQIKSSWPGPMREVRVVPDIAGGEPATVIIDTPRPMEDIEILSEPAPQVLETKTRSVTQSEARPAMPRVEIFIVSYAPDIPYLKYNLRSISKFCDDFIGVTVLAPRQHKEDFELLNPELPFPFTLRFYTAPADRKKWHIAHQLQKCYADKWCPDADFILHTDSDCIFTKPTNPLDFFIQNTWRPILCIEPFERCGPTWKKEIDEALQIDSKYETMRRHGAIHPRDIYKAFREFMTKIHGEKIDVWWMRQKADYPWGVTEFNFLGNYVKHILNDVRYAFIDVSKEYPPESPIFQFWSHKPPEEPQNFPGGGAGTPLEKLKALGLV